MIFEDLGGANHKFIVFTRMGKKGSALQAALGIRFPEVGLLPQREL
jgi:hypothetical protein